MLKPKLPAPHGNVEIDIRFLCYLIRIMPDTCKAKWELLAYLYGKVA